MSEAPFGHSMLLHGPWLTPSVNETDKLAVWSLSDQATYAELASRVDAIAAYLGEELGVVAGDRVGINLSKSVTSVAVILATLRIGAVYVPMDPLSPAARIATIARDCQAACLFCDDERTAEVARLLADMDAGTKCVLGSVITGISKEALPNQTSNAALIAKAAEVHPGALAAILYTSGSTGVPKGVKLTHENIATFALWAVERFEMGPDDRFANHAPFHFDLSTLDLFAAFYAGATVYLLDEQTKKFPAAVSKILDEQQITIWYSVPTALKLLREKGALRKRNIESLRLIFFAGETFALESLRSTVSAFPSARFINLYGPTETNVCTYYEVQRDDLESRISEIPIGVPCEHYGIQILLPSGEPAAVGERGEICVFGKGVTAGYWSRDDETAKRRVHGRPDSYRTGDIGSYCADGNIEFFGRMDYQVKVNGYRVELMEVQSVLARHRAVSEVAAVLSRGTKNGTGQDAIIAYATVYPDEPINVSELQDHCAKLLPEYAVPEVIVADNLPRTSTGKIDYQRLQNSDISVTEELSPGEKELVN